MKKWTYFDTVHKITHRAYQNPAIFGRDGQLENTVIQFSGFSHSKPFHCLATNILPCLDNVEKGQCLPLYRYNSDGRQIENITDWGLQQFQNHYQNKDISKLQIFQVCLRRSALPPISQNLRVQFETFFSAYSLLSRLSEVGGAG